MSLTHVSEDLSDLTKKLNAHMPDICATITGLIPELRIIERRNLGNTRDRIEMDARNLATQLAELADFAQEGIENEDTHATRSAMRALANDLRRRTRGLIQERTAMLRVEAEVSAERVDQDALPTDFTEEYRVIAASPNKTFRGDARVPKRFDLPETGGLTGYLTGKFYTTFIKDPKRQSNTISPMDTFFLPEDRSITLLEGETIVLRIQGNSWKEDDLCYLNFRQEQSDLLIEVASGGATLQGPATFSVHEHEDIKGHRQHVHDVHKILATLSMNDEKTLNFVEDSEYSFITTIMITIGLALGAVATGGSFAAGLPWLGSIFALTSVYPIFWSVNKYRRYRKIRKALISALKEAGCDKMNEKHEKFAWIQNVNYDEIKFDTLKKHMSDVFIKGAGHYEYAEFFPAREAIVRERQGIRVIEPLPALPAPTPDIDLGLGDIIQMKKPA